MAYLLHQLLPPNAQRFSEKQAVRHKGAHLTYTQLDEQSNQLAGTLLQAGVERGDRVGIYLDKSLPAVVAIFGILKAGAAYVPLDPAAPKQRIAFIIDNCQMKAVISTADKINGLSKKTADLLTTLQAVIVADNAAKPTHPFPHLFTWSDMLAMPTAAPADTGAIENDLAYILYTSGSTGTPKGVMISHRAALTFVNWGQETFNVQASDRLSNHAPFHFDLSIFDLFVAIKAGATVVLVPPSLSVFPRNLADFIAQEEITIWYSVPSALTRLILYGQLERHSFPHLHTILFAGEVFPIKYLRQLLDLLPQRRYYNLYGPTETNVCTFYEVDVEEITAVRTHPVSIGKACANTETFVLDDTDTVVAAGEEGELCVRGPSVMSGYWGLPERTHQSRILFTRHPQLGAEVVYRTGDLVREEADGNYTYLGRRDNMIKSRGYRIELGEIETALYSHPEVKEAAVVAIPDDEIGNRILAFIALQNGTPLPANKLASFCAQQIPKYMVPHAFEFRETLPKTSTGKVNKPQLKQEIAD
ncbi:MAG: amino acid adenylation domain-containing protein [Chloroflexota bacterium]